MIVDEQADSREIQSFEFFPMNSKTLRGKTRRYRASPATRTLCAAGMLVLVCLVGAIMHYTLGDRRRLSGDDVTSKIECDNSLDQVPVLAVILYAVCLIVLFIGLANVTDDFFVPALTVMGDRLKLSEDVTGATLMASGSSAPELFTSSVDAFLHGTSIGIGTVVGSAVFNILVIIACSGAWASSSLVIDWKPFTRDCTFYSFSILLLVVFIEWDGDVEGRIWWWEGLIMFCCYAFYVAIMAYNQSLMSCMARCAGEKDDNDEEGNDLLQMEKLQANVVGAFIIFYPSDCCNEKAFEHFEPLAKDIVGVKVVYHDIEQSMFRVEFEANTDASKHKAALEGIAREAIETSRNIGEIASKLIVDCKIVNFQCHTVLQDDNSEDDGDVDQEEDSELCFFLRWLEAVAGFFSTGWEVVFKHIPDVNTEEMRDELKETGFLGDELQKTPDELLEKIRKKERGYQATFLLSILWIGVICIFMVELAERIGCLIGIKSLFMGLTVLAAGTSIPDALGSIASAKRGMGDMAVANAIGSNVFDILIGLGLPWFLRGVIYKEAYMVLVDDLKIFIGILFSTIFITLLAFVVTKWKLGPALGKMLLAAYFAFLFFAFVYVYVLD